MIIGIIFWGLRQRRRKNSKLFIFKMEPDDFEEKKDFFNKKFLIFGSIFGVVVIFLAIFAYSSPGHGFFGNLKASVAETFGEVLGFKQEKPIYELDLATGEGKNLVTNSNLENKANDSASKGAPKNNLQVEGSKKAAVAVANGDKKEITPASKILPSENLPTGEASIPKKPETIQRECSFSPVDAGASGLSREIIFNEVAWMGGKNSSNDEWIEIKNNSSGEINLTGWQIKNKDESIKIVFNEKDKISARGSPTGEFLLLERTDDNSVPNIPADKTYSGALSNSGEWLKIFNADCKLVDEINSGGGWNFLGGENSSKKTLERNVGDLAWHTSENPGGTPRAKNSEPVFIENNPPVVAPSNPPASSPPAEQPVASTNPGVSGTTPQTTSTPPAEPSPPQDQSLPKVLISEVVAGSSSSSDYEFIEIYNAGSGAVDLTGWAIKKKSSSGVESSLVAASRLNGKTILAGKYLLLAHDGGYTGAVSPDVLWPASYSLAYTNNSITIYDASGALIDQVSWAEIPKDKSYSRASLDILAGFAVSDTPSPQNSQ